MGSFASFLTGALSGAAAGGPAGAAFGAVAGLFGGDNSVEQTLRDFTPGEINMLRQIERQMPGVLDQLDPAEVQRMAKEFSANFTEEGLRQVGDVFGKKREQLRLDQVRSGGVLGSVNTELRGRLGREESIARTSTINNANVAGQNVAQSILAGNQNTASTLSGVATSIYGNQARTAGQTEPGSAVRDFATAGLSASINPESFLNRKFGDLFGGV